MESVYEGVANLLMERGWVRDLSAQEDKHGELREFLHPVTSKAYAWIDAVLEQASLEEVA